MCDWAVEQNVAAFSEFSFAMSWQGRLYAVASTTSNTPNPM